MVTSQFIHQQLQQYGTWHTNSEHVAQRVEEFAHSFEVLGFLRSAEQLRSRCSPEFITKYAALIDVLLELSHVTTDVAEVPTSPETTDFKVDFYEPVEFEYTDDLETISSSFETELTDVYEGAGNPINLNINPLPSLPQSGLTVANAILYLHGYLDVSYLTAHHTLVEYFVNLKREISESDHRMPILAKIRHSECSTLLQLIKACEQILNFNYEPVVNGINQLSYWITTLTLPFNDNILKFLNGDTEMALNFEISKCLYHPTLYNICVYHSVLREVCNYNHQFTLTYTNQIAYSKQMYTLMFSLKQILQSKLKPILLASFETLCNYHLGQDPDVIEALLNNETVEPPVLELHSYLVKWLGPNLEKMFNFGDSFIKIKNAVHNDQEVELRMRERYLKMKQKLNSELGKYIT